MLTSPAVKVTSSRRSFFAPGRLSAAPEISKVSSVCHRMAHIATPFAGLVWLKRIEVPLNTASS
jgi:hypothetical protein